jgi:hypothetical protein
LVGEEERMVEKVRLHIYGENIEEATLPVSVEIAGKSYAQIHTEALLSISPKAWSNVCMVTMQTGDKVIELH